MVVSFFSFFHIHTFSDLFREDSHFNLYLPVGLKLPTRTCPSPDIRSPLATGANREPPQLLVSEMVGGKKHGTKTETWELAQSQVWSFNVPFFSRPQKVKLESVLNEQVIPPVFSNSMFFTHFQMSVLTNIFQLQLKHVQAPISGARLPQVQTESHRQPPPWHSPKFGVSMFGAFLTWDPGWDEGG